MAQILRWPLAVCPWTGDWISLFFNFLLHLVVVTIVHTPHSLIMGSRWLNGKEATCQCRRCEFSPWVGKIRWRRAWQPTPVFLPGEFHGQRSLAGYNPWGHKELATAEWMSMHVGMCEMGTLQTVLGPHKDATFKGHQPPHWSRACSFCSLPSASTLGPIVRAVFLKFHTEHSIPFLQTLQGLTCPRSWFLRPEPGPCLISGHALSGTTCPSSAEQLTTAGLLPLLP